MAEITKTGGSAKRFGARYGRTTRSKISDIEKTMRNKIKCPYCSKMRIKRVAAGIWQCRNCGVKFSGAAYALKKEEKEEAIENG